MSDENAFLVKRECDSKLIGDFKEFYEKYNQYIYQIYIELRIGEAINLNRADNSLANWKTNALLNIASESQSYLVASITVKFRSQNLIFLRGEKSTFKSLLFDVVKQENVNNNDSSVPVLSAELKILVLKFIQEKLSPISTLQQISPNVPKEYEALVSHHSSTMSKLEDLSENLLSKHHDKLQELDRNYQEKSRSLDLDYQKKIDELNINVSKEREKLYSGIVAEKEALKNKLSELDARSSKLDDRDNTHVRREIRDKMLEDVKNRVSNFGVSRETNKKRSPVYNGILLLITIFLGLLFFSVIELKSIHAENAIKLDIFNKKLLNDKDNNEKLNLTIESKNINSVIDMDNSILYWMWVKITLTTIGLIGTILFYIKWQNRWAEYHATTEFQLQQFQIDVNRANWVLESCLEWFNETKTEIPPVLLEQFTKNLFIGENKHLEKVIHPSDELASALLGSASKLKLNVGGNELEIKKPGNIKPKTTVGECS